MRHRTVNLAILATTDDGKGVSNETRYRRFQDFFRTFALCFSAVGQLIIDRIPMPKSGYVLAMDRTNWKFGRTHVNFLVIAIVVGKVSVPVVWKVLPQSTKCGNSNCRQRIALSTNLLKLIPAKDIRVLTIDREFVGKPWLTWLDKHDVGYVVRVKKNTIVGRHVAARLAERRGRKSQKRQKIFDLELFFSCKKLSKDGRASHLYVISNRFVGKKALDFYRQRWGIERLFGHMKKKGFDLEATHMSEASKLEILFAVVVLAFLFSFAWGCHLRGGGGENNAATRRKSLFRQGLEDILRMISMPPDENDNSEKIRRFCHWLLSPVVSSIFLV